MDSSCSISMLISIPFVMSFILIPFNVITVLSFLQPKTSVVRVHVVSVLVESSEAAGSSFGFQLLDLDVDFNSDSVLRFHFRFLPYGYLLKLSAPSYLSRAHTIPFARKLPIPIIHAYYVIHAVGQKR